MQVYVYMYMKANLEAVPNAVRIASAMCFMKTNGFRLAKKRQKSGSTMKKCIARPMTTVAQYRPSWRAAVAMSSIKTICLARIDATPIGDSLQAAIHLQNMQTYMHDRNKQHIQCCEDQVLNEVILTR